MPVFNNALAGAAGSGGAAGYTIERSLRFNSVDSANLSKTFLSAGNRRTFTFSCWIKRTKLAREAIFSAGSAVGSSFGLEFNGNNTLDIYDYNGSFTWRLETTPVFRDPASFFHLILSVDTTQATANNRVKVYINGSQVTNFDISNYPSQNHESFVNNNILHTIGSYQNNTLYSNALLSDIHFVDGQALAPTDFGEFDADTGVWNPIEYSGTYGTNGFHLDFSDNSSNAALGTDSSGNSNTWTVNNLTATTTTTNWASQLSVNNSNNSISNPGNAFDGDLTTYARLSLESGGDRGIVWTPATTTTVSSSLRVYWRSWTSTQYNNGYVYVNGQSQGQVPSNQNGWYTVSFTGTINSMELRSQYNSGGGHQIDWVAIEVDGSIIKDPESKDIDSLLDSPTNYEADSGNNGGNYCTLNPLQKSSEVTLSNGNLDVSTSSTSNKCKVFGTMAVTSGKWYYEVTIGSNYRGSFGWATDPNSNLAQQPGDSSGDYALTFDGQKVKSGTYTGSYGTAYSSGMVIGIRLDATAGTVAFSQDGVDKGNAYTGQTDLTWWPIVGDASSGGTFNGSVNFGQRPFAYTPPTGYKSLCTQNLDDPLIADPSKYFDTKLWTGNGGEQIIGGGIRYSDYVTGTIDSANPATKAFDGITTNTGVRTATASNISITFQPPTPLAFSASFKIWCARDGTNAGNTFVVHHAGGSTDFTSSVTTGTTNTAVDLAQLSGVTSPISKIVVSSGGSNPRFSGIEVDGSMLIDSTADPYNFSPDLLWIKSRNTGAWHVLADNVRGPGKILSTNDPATEDGSAAAQTAIQSFDSNGFTVEHHSSWTVNSDNNPHVGWAWDAGSSNTTISVGSKNSSVYDQSQTWSDDIGSTRAGDPAVNAFNGNPANEAANQGTSLAWNVSLTNVSTLQIRCRSSNGSSGNNLTITGNGISNLSVPGQETGEIKTLTVTNSSVSNINVATSNLNGLAPGICQVFVNGKELVDTNATPPNVPSIASTCRANQDAGFSICSYNPTGSDLKVAHGLNTKPSLIFLKSRNVSGDWLVMHDNTDPSKFLKLNLNQAEVSITNGFLSVDSSTFGTGNDSGINSSGQQKIAFCFAPVEGYSAFGSYVSNNNVDGPFVYLGFQPKLIIWKNRDANHGWYMYDDARNPDNPMSKYLAVHDSIAEGDPGGVMDVLSNGFKVRNTGFDMNTGSNRILYMAWAESPFKYNRAR